MVHLRVNRVLLLHFPTNLASTKFLTLPHSLNRRRNLSWYSIHGNSVQVERKFPVLEEQQVEKVEKDTRTCRQNGFISGMTTESWTFKAITKKKKKYIKTGEQLHLQEDFHIFILLFFTIIPLYLFLSMNLQKGSGSKAKVAKKTNKIEKVKPKLKLRSRHFSESPEEYKRLGFCVIEQVRSTLPLILIMGSIIVGIVYMYHQRKIFEKSFGKPALR